MNIFFWGRQIALMLWLETVVDRRKFIARTLVFAVCSGLCTLGFAIVLAGISYANQNLGRVYAQTAQWQAQKTGGGEPIQVPVFDANLSLSEDTTKRLIKFFQTDSGPLVAKSRPDRLAVLTVEERLTQAALDAEDRLKMYKNTPRLKVYTNSVKLWPVDVRQQVEKMFSPVQEVSEETYLNTLQKSGNIWIGIRENNGQLQWRGWGPGRFLNTKSDSQISILQNYIHSVGVVYQQHYLDQIKNSAEYKSLAHWEDIFLIETFTPIDVRALSLFLCLAVFVLPTLLAASQAITWDFNRNKNVYEPYATMKIPVWGVLSKESLSGFWYLVFWAVITVVMCGLIVSRQPSYWFFLSAMIALGLGGCWLNLQTNMFLVVTFQTPVGRQLARLLVMPFFFLPYHIFRVLGATQILRILDGKSLEEFQVGWIWLSAAACFIGGSLILCLAAWRVGRYRKGLAPS